MDIATLVVQLLGGLIGGNLSGTLLKNLGLGALGNSLAGLVGGGLGGHLISTYLNLPPVDTVSLDPMAVVGQLLSGGGGGILVQIVIGVLKKALGK